MRTQFERYSIERLKDYIVFQLIPAGFPQVQLRETEDGHIQSTNLKKYPSSSFIHSFICQIWIECYCVPGTVLGPEIIAVSEIFKHPSFHGSLMIIYVHISRNQE